MADKQAEYDASFEEEKRRYEADPYNYRGNPNSPWAREEARRQRKERKRIAQGGKPARPGEAARRGAPFTAPALAAAHAIESDGEEWDDGAAPVDEIEALRTRLVAMLRRQPADIQSLMRSAQALSRMEAVAHRLNPDKTHKLGGSMLAVLNSLNDPRKLPPEGQ